MRQLRIYKSGKQHGCTVEDAVLQAAMFRGFIVHRQSNRGAWPVQLASRPRSAWPNLYAR